MHGHPAPTNIDAATVHGFGQEWAAFDQANLEPAMHEFMAQEYFSIFPFDRLPASAEGFDLGCGSGRWAAWILPRVGLLHCIDPAPEALAVARGRLKDDPRAQFHNESVDAISLPEASQDFGYSLGVLHHVPNTESGLLDCVRRLKPGAPFLLYLYYDFENRPKWFRALWKVSDIVRRGISRLPFFARKGLSTVLAALIYWPLARASRLADKAGLNVSNIPLSNYRCKTFYTMRTDSLDRFGTRLERRFSRASIEAMMRRCGLEEIRFKEGEPFWVACGVRGASSS